MEKGKRLIEQFNKEFHNLFFKELGLFDETTEKFTPSKEKCDTYKAEINKTWKSFLGAIEELNIVEGDKVYEALRLLYTLDALHAEMRTYKLMHLHKTNICCLSVNPHENSIK